MTAQTPEQAMAAMHEMLMAMPVDEIELTAIDMVSDENGVYDPDNPVHALRLILFNLVRWYQIESEQPGHFGEPWASNVGHLNDFASILQLFKIESKGDTWRVLPGAYEGDTWV